jgi:hypothetical protein
MAFEPNSVVKMHTISLDAKRRQLQRLVGRLLDRAMSRHAPITLPEMTWQMIALGCLPACDAVERSHASTPWRSSASGLSRWRCLRSRQHKKTFDCITISCISWTRRRSNRMPPNGGVQRRAIESERAVSTNSVSKIATISLREARPLQRDGRPARKNALGLWHAAATLHEWHERQACTSGMRPPRSLSWHPRAMLRI